jgi:hypothetical protein
MLNHLKFPLKVSIVPFFLLLLFNNVLDDQLLYLASESVDDIYSNIAVSDHNFEASVTSET